MVCDRHEVADCFVTREGVRIRTIFLFDIFESRDDESKVPLCKTFHKLASFVYSKPKQVVPQVVFNEGPKIGTRNKIDIQHHHIVRSSVQPSQVSPSVELPRPFRRLKWGENEMDVDVG